MYGMKNWSNYVVVTMLGATVAVHANSIASGKVKSIDADNKTFVLTDGAGKDFSFKFGENLVVNRDGNESKSDIKVGDNASICYDQGVLTWTSHYILIHEGAHKDSSLTHGAFKSFDTEKNAMVFTDARKNDCEYAANDVAVRVNMKKSSGQDLRIGEQALLISKSVNDKAQLLQVMVERTK